MSKPNIVNVNDVRIGDYVTVKFRVDSVNRITNNVFIRNDNLNMFGDDNDQFAIVSLGDVESFIENPDRQVIPAEPLPGKAKVVMIGDDLYRRSEIRNSVWFRWEVRDGGRSLVNYSWAELVRIARCVGKSLILLDATKAVS